MGASIPMIEDHYGHVNPIKNARQILQGMPGWERVVATPQGLPQPGEAATTARDPKKGKKTARGAVNRTDRQCQGNQSRRTVTEARFPAAQTHVELSKANAPRRIG